jgi:hypothetical protein
VGGADGGVGFGPTRWRYRRQPLRETPSMLERAPTLGFRELEATTVKINTHDILSHTTKRPGSYEDHLLVDIDARVTKTQFVRPGIPEKQNGRH